MGLLSKGALLTLTPADLATNLGHRPLKIDAGATRTGRPASATIPAEAPDA